MKKLNRASRAKHSRNIHSSKMRLVFHPSPLVKKIILTIIVLAIVIVACVAGYSLLFTKENQIKHQITDLSKEYYEEYFYKNLAESGQDAEKVSDYLEKYREKGLSNVTLNVLLSYDDHKNSTYEDFLGDNCDRNKTFVKIYPEPPYDKKSYHIEYTYSCNYE